MGLGFEAGFFFAAVLVAVFRAGAFLEAVAFFLDVAAFFLEAAVFFTAGFLEAVFFAAVFFAAGFFFDVDFFTAVFFFTGFLETAFLAAVFFFAAGFFAVFLGLEPDFFFVAVLAATFASGESIAIPEERLTPVERSVVESVLGFWFVGRY
ncbi:MAG TPA: hypothetical protein VGB30_10510 [bacterium]